MVDEKDSLPWGPTVEQLRGLRRWKQEHLAREAGISKSSLSDYERGKLDPPDAIRARVEEALGAAAWFDWAQAMHGWMLGQMEGGGAAPGVEQFFQEAAARAGGSTAAALRAGLESLRRKRK